MKGGRRTYLDFVFIGMLFLQGAFGGELLLNTKKKRSNPDLIGYNVGHFMEGGNAKDWWRYSGVNAARVFLSPKTVESKDDLEPWGDGVATLQDFLARKALVQGDPLNEEYIYWPYFYERYANKVFSGNRFQVDHLFTELRSLGVDILVQITASQDHLIITDENDWAGKWELWQHYFAQAFYLARTYDVTRYQIYNEPNHSNAKDLTPEDWLMRIQLASDAIQTAIAEVNTRDNKTLAPLVYGPVNSGGADAYDNGWGDYLVANRHTNFLGETSDDIHIIHRYDYHEYNSEPSEFGDDLDWLRSQLSADMAPETRYRVSISEYNVHTNSTFDTLPEVIDDPVKFSRFGAISVNLAQSFMKEFYAFKFAQNASDEGDNYPVKKNGMHYVDNTSAPYHYGGATQAAEVYRLFTKALYPGGDQLDIDKDSDGSLDPLDISFTYRPETDAYYVFSANYSGDDIPLSINASPLSLPNGRPFLMESVSATHNGNGRAWGTVTADGTLETDEFGSNFVQPAHSVWLITLPAGALYTEQTLPCEEDAMVKDGIYAANNYGVRSSIEIRNDGDTVNKRKAGLFKFQTKVPYPPDIQLAVLSFHAKTETTDFTAQAHLYGISDDSWQEDTVTWQLAPNLMQDKASGNLIADRFLTGQGETAQMLSQLTVSSTTETEVLLNVTDFMQQQDDQTASFLVVQEPRWNVTLPELTEGDVQADSIHIQSKEDATYAPQLKLLLLPDTDGDGLSDNAELTVFMTDPTTVDTDGDGHSDGDEVFAKTDPTSPESHLKLRDFRLSSSPPYLSWETELNRSYTLLKSATLDEADWTELQTISGNGTTVYYQDEELATEARQFYKIKID